VIYHLLPGIKGYATPLGLVSLLACFYNLVIPLGLEIDNPKGEIIIDFALPFLNPEGMT
jgi:hypothetical protein